MKTLAALALVVASAVALPLTANAHSLTIHVDTPHLGIHFGTPLRPVPVYYGRPGDGYYVPVRQIGHGKYKYRHDRRHERRHDRRDRYDD